MSKNKKFVVIKPPLRVKYKKFCKHIRDRHRKNYIYYENDKLKINIHFLMNLLIEKLKPPINQAYVRHKKYKESDFVDAIIDVIQNNTYWNRYKGLVPGKYLNRKHNDYCKWNVYECLYRIILKEYYSTDKYAKLHYQSIDSTFVTNLYGSELYGRNVKYKSKNGINVSLITDALGVPNSVALAPGNRHDSVVAKEQLESSFFVDPNTKKVRNNNKYSQKMLGDAAYHDNDLYAKLIKKGYTPITDVNKRKTKDKDKIKQLNKMKRKYLKNSFKRIVIENCNAWIKKFPKISRVIEKTTRSFNGLLLLSLTHIVNNKLG